MNLQKRAFCQHLAEALRKGFSNPYNNSNGGFGLNGALDRAVGAPARLGGGMHMHLGGGLRGSSMRGGGGGRQFGATASPLGQQNPGVRPNYVLHQRLLIPSWMKAYRNKHAPAPASLAPPTPGKTSSNGFV